MTFTPSKPPPSLQCPRPSWLHRLPRPIFDLLEGIYAVVERGGSSLTVAGLRMLVEAVAKDGVPGKITMRERLEVLYRQGIISSGHCERLLRVVEHGNKAVHENVAVQGEDLSHLLLCVEHLLQEFYVLRCPLPS
ncbi:DUF4145 domain-containing protein, partial [Corallococcus sp. CA053C]|uniref:DUF4145 domain-containing protein n=1 Tax=Corallococcus sp. CA053C TaxID=2316732 RepID=UPI000EA07A52